MDGRVIASARPTRRGRRPGHVRTLFVGNGGGGKKSGEGEEPKPTMQEPEEVQLRHSSNEVSEQSRATGGGVGGAKGGDREETRTSKAGAGHRTGKACHRRRAACGKPQ